MTLRRRLTVVLALAVGLFGAALAIGSYLLVRHNLLADSVDSGVAQTRRNLEIAPFYLNESTDSLLAAYKRRGGFLTLVVRKGRPFSSDFVGERQVPASLRGVVGRGDLGYQRTTVAGTPYLVTGAPLADGTQLYFFYAEQGLRHELSQLRNILLGGLVIIVLLAAVAGVVLARSTLRPVARASEAAHSLAEGLLETRLPVEGTDESSSISTGAEPWMLVTPARASTASTAESGM